MVERWQALQVPAGRVLVREGEISQRAYFIERGCLRLWFMKGKRDLTFQFFFEGEFVSVMESFRHGRPSLFTLEAIEPCQLHSLEKADFDRNMAVVNTNPSTLRGLLDAAYDRQLHYMRHFMSFLRDTPEERYRRLAQDHPQLLQRVPQHYIASYLGITPVSLSRIRARLVRGDRQGP